MNIITFPKNEWDSIKSRFNDGKIVCTIRVSREYKKFKEGDVLKTEWGLEVRIMSVKKITGGISELKIKYKFFDELTEEMIQELSDYDKMEIISLGTISRS
jgi:hypothetical protein